MKNVGVVTYCEWDSYGAVLQALALKNHLTSFDCNVENIRLDTVSHKELKLFYKGKGIKNLIINCHRFLIRKKLKRRFNLTMKFLSENFNFRSFTDYEQLMAEPPIEDVYIAGSDQIWNPNKINPFFYLDFVKDSDKKISYAASMGSLSVLEANKSEWYRLINGFKAVSVREQGVKEVISSGIDKEISVNIDPTLLIDMENWKKLEKSYSIKKPYILVYPLYWDTKLNSQLKILHKKTGLPIVAITSKVQLAYANKRIYDASIEEFLWLFDNATYVVTSSFHGAVFSIIFKKKFSVVINPNKPSRLESLLNLFQIQNINISDLADNNGPDYDKVYNILKIERERANEYLSKGINQE